jgi:BRCT domain type II-containing protein
VCSWAIVPTRAREVRATLRNGKISAEKAATLCARSQTNTNCRESSGSSNFRRAPSLLPIINSEWLVNVHAVEATLHARSDWLRASKP